MIGIDPRTTGERMAEQLKGLDPENPDSLLQAAQALQSIDPVRAASLRQMAAQVEATKRKETMQQAESDALIKQRTAETAAAEERTLSSRLGRESSAAQETLEASQAQLSINASARIMDRVSPEIASQFSVLFPTTLSGAEQARQFALESIRSPERETFVETIVDSDGIPQRVVYDKNDENYERILGVDEAVLQGNKGKPFGKLQAKSGSIIPQDAFDYKANANKILSIAFNPELESIVGPADPGGIVPLSIGAAVPQFLGGLSDEQVQLRRDIEISQTAGILPIIRLLAPVTDTDRDMLMQMMPGRQDRQSMWIQRTIEEVIPQALNVMYRSLNKEGLSLSAAQQFAFSASSEVFDQIAETPNIFGDYSLERAVDAAYQMLPTVDEIDINEMPKDLLLFKDVSGKVYNGEVIQSIQKAKGYDAEQIQSVLGLELIPRTN
jgi:hypothetical protein